MRRARNDRGAVAIIVAALATVLFITAALVIDLGLARDTRRQAQNAADASALAAANSLYATPGLVDVAGAITDAKWYAATNYGVTETAWSTCGDPDRLAYVPTGGSPCISFDQAVKPTQIRVRIPTRDLPTGLGALAGVEDISISAVARAALEPGVLIECSLCVIGDGAHSIGNGDISIINVTGGGGIHVNGSLVGQPNSEVSAPSGSITIEGNFGGSDFTPEPESGPRIEDPFAALVLPSYAGLARKTDPCGAGGGSGVYQDYELGNGTCTLSAGLYVFTGRLSLKNTSRLTGTGVTLLFTCGTSTAPRTCSTSGEPGGAFDATNGEVTLNGSDPRLPGHVIVYDRGNTSPMTLQGNGNSVLTGNVYAKNALLYANGNSCHTVSQGSIIVRDLYMNGNQSCLNVNNTSPARFELPPGGLHLDQ